MNTFYHLFTFEPDKLTRLGDLSYKRSHLINYPIAHSAVLRWLHAYYLRTQLMENGEVGLSSMTLVKEVVGSSTLYADLQREVIPQLFDVGSSYSTLSHQSKKYRLKKEWDCEWILSEKKYLIKNAPAGFGFSIDIKPALASWEDSIAAIDLSLPENLIKKESILNFHPTSGINLPSECYPYVTLGEEKTKAMTILDSPFLFLLSLYKTDCAEKKSYENMMERGELLDSIVFCFHRANENTTYAEARSHLENYLTRHAPEAPIEELFKANFPRLHKAVVRYKKANPKRLIKKLRRMEKAVLDEVAGKYPFDLFRIPCGFICAKSEAEEVKKLLLRELENLIGFEPVIKIN